MSSEIQEELPNRIRQYFTIRANEIALECKRQKLKVERGLKLVGPTIILTILIGGAIQLIPQTARILTSIVQFFIVGALSSMNWAAIWDTYEAYILEYRDLVRKMRIYEKITRTQIRIITRP